MMAIGTPKSQVLQGSGAGDIIRGGAGNDVIKGSNGDDTINGGGGNDLINGGAGNDSLFGGAGNDVLIGGLGDDFLNGGVGENILSGGTGNDRFVFYEGQTGSHLINDFRFYGDNDKVIFREGVTVVDLQDSATGAILTIDTGDGISEIRFKNWLADDLMNAAYFQGAGDFFA
jgi:Ca2+-binding RTX toxin-like protein